MNGARAWCGALLAAGAVQAAAADEPAAPDVAVTNPPLREQRAAGPYRQPEWTTARRFPTTRVYLQQPPGGLAAEQWVRTRVKDGTVWHRVQEGIEVGLPHRLQVDLRYTWTVDGAGIARHDYVAGEARWAPADWGAVPMNPALAGEYRLVGGAADPDIAEAKLFLGEQVGKAWRWGANLIYGRELGGEKVEDWALSQAMGYSVLDSRLGLGVEMKYVRETALHEGVRGAPWESLVAGPSVQWRPRAGMRLDAAPLFGLTGDAPAMELHLVFGWDFGPGNAKARGPVSPKRD